MNHLIRLLLLVLLTSSVLLAESFKKPDYDNRLDKYPNTMEWYNHADTDSASAFNIGLLYDTRINDNKLAELWYKKALDIDNKNIYAMFNLGLLYENEKKYDFAIKWYKQAAFLKDLRATVNLGLLYDNHLKNYQEAEKWYKKAIERESLDAMKNLSLLYYSQKKYVQAVEYMLPLSDRKYTKKKVFALFRTHWKFSEATIKKGYEAQLKSTIIPEKLKYKGGI